MITLDTLHLATEQEVFDQVAKHLLTQNEQSYDSRSCRYKFKHLKCAAGSLISDKEYDPFKFEGFPWDTLVRRNKVTKTHAALIINLQSIHDWSEPYHWIDKLQGLADEYGLSPNILEGFK